MKIENTFTIEDVKGFMSSYREREQSLLADRLDRLSKRLLALAPHVSQGTTESEEWNAHELLAHIAVVSKFYGVMVHRIASGQMTEIGLVDSVNLRDVAGKQMAEHSPEELVRLAVADHHRTIEALRTVDANALQKTARLDDGTTMTAEEVARLPLISHLETHVDDLERMVGR